MDHDTAFIQAEDRRRRYAKPLGQDSLSLTCQTASPSVLDVAASEGSFTS